LRFFELRDGPLYLNTRGGNVQQCLFFNYVRQLIACRDCVQISAPSFRVSEFAQTVRGGRTQNSLCPCNCIRLSGASRGCASTIACLLYSATAQCMQLAFPLIPLVPLSLPASAAEAALAGYPYMTQPRGPPPESHMGVLDFSSRAFPET
jgi:hypothetical protein